MCLSRQTGRHSTALSSASADGSLRTPPLFAAHVQAGGRVGNHYLMLGGMKELRQSASSGKWSAHEENLRPSAKHIWLLLACLVLLAFVNLNGKRNQSYKECSPHHHHHPSFLPLSSLPTPARLDLTSFARNPLFHSVTKKL